MSQRKGTEEEIKGIESGKCLKIENADSRNWDLDIAGIVQCFLNLVGDPSASVGMT